MARAQARLRGRAVALERGVRLIAVGGAAGCAAGAVVQAAGRRCAGRQAEARDDRRRGTGRVDSRHVVPASDQRAHPASISRLVDGGPRVARGVAAGVGRDGRASRAPRVPRSPRDAAQPGVRARPHVHVAVHHLRVDPPPRRDGRAADVDPPGAGAARRLRAAHCVDVDLAAGGRASGGRAGCVGQSPGAAPVRRRHHRAARQGGAGDSDRRPPRGAAPRRMGALVRTGRPSPPAQRRVAHAGVGDLRRGVRGRRRVRGVGARGGARRRAASARGGLAPLGLHRRHRGRDRVPARHLARGLPAPGLARGLRGLAVARRGRVGARATG